MGQELGSQAAAERLPSADRIPKFAPAFAFTLTHFAVPCFNFVVREKRMAILIDVVTNQVGTSAGAQAGFAQKHAGEI